MEIVSIYDQFLSLSTATGDDGGITRPTFETCLGALRNHSNIIVDRLFHFFDQDDDNIISFEEMVRGLSILCKGTLEERIICILY
jgi:Ca2+-binding EF-hand superfamily protein